MRPGQICLFSHHRAIRNNGCLIEVRLNLLQRYIAVLGIYESVKPGFKADRMAARRDFEVGSFR